MRYYRGPRWIEFEKGCVITEVHTDLGYKKKEKGCVINEMHAALSLKKGWVITEINTDLSVKKKGWCVITEVHATWDLSNL